MELIGDALDKLSEPGFWSLVVVVGLTIEFYGQVIVPYLRDTRPIDAFRHEARHRPGLLVLSIPIAFGFPFRVDLDGEFVQMGRSTRELLEVYPADNAIEMLGTSAWERVLTSHREARPLGTDLVVEFGGESYLIAYSSSVDGAYVNLYLAHLVGDLCDPPPIPPSR